MSPNDVACSWVRWVGDGSARKGFFRRGQRTQNTQKIDYRFFHHGTSYERSRDGTAVNRIAMTVCVFFILTTINKIRRNSHKIELVYNQQKTRLVRIDFDTNGVNMRDDREIIPPFCMEFRRGLNGPSPG